MSDKPKLKVVGTTGKAKPAKNNMVTLMRELRKVLPEDTKKVEGELAYIVAGKVRVTFNYYCKWDKDTNKRIAPAEVAKTCVPHSLTVSIDEGALEYGPGRMYNRSAIFRTRTITSGGQDKYNVGSVAVAVTKALEAFDKFMVDQKIQEQKREEVERVHKAQKANLLNAFPGLKANSYSCTNKNSQVAITPYFEDDVVKFDLNLSDLSLEQILTIKDFIQGIIDAGEQEDSSEEQAKKQRKRTARLRRIV